MSRVKGRWCAVTGATSGIGKAVAETLAAEGAKVILISRNEAKLQAVAASLSSSDAKCVVEIVVADMSRPQDVEQAASRVMELTRPTDDEVTHAAQQGHGLYMLVNNAGSGAPTGMSAVKGDPDEWDTLMQLNTLSIMRLTRRLSQTLMDAAKSGPHEHTGMGQGAVLVNIGSVAGVETVSGMGAYCATKAALRAWSLCTFRDLRPHNIKVTVIEPGYVDTALLPDSAGPRERMIRAADIAAAVLMVADTSLSCCPEEIVLRPVLPVS